MISETLFQTAHDVLTVKTIKEGVDYPNFENVMNKSWETEVSEHNGNQAEAYKCLRKNVKNQVLHGWIIDHLPDGRGTVGTKVCQVFLNSFKILIKVKLSFIMIMVKNFCLFFLIQFTIF